MKIFISGPVRPNSDDLHKYNKMVNESGNPEALIIKNIEENNIPIVVNGDGSGILNLQGNYYVDIRMKVERFDNGYLSFWDIATNSIKNK